MVITLKTKIWLTVLSIVLMFAFFTLFYFPAERGKLLLKNYNTEVQNLANTVSLGVKIAITEQNFEGVQTAMEFVKDDPRLKFVSMLQSDTVWNNDHTKFKIKLSVFKTFPETEHPKTTTTTSDSLIVKQAPFVTSIMSGSIMLAFTTREIIESKREIAFTSLMVSGIVLLIGIVIGFWLARNISVPILALRDAVKRVGEGDLTQRVNSERRDEIGELSEAFNTMIDDLSRARKELSETNVSLLSANNSLSDTLSELKTTQAQLIQSEKMASLGELTAGIAHEIQNPLNFVNNFSEVNAELTDELVNELALGNKENAISIARTINENAQKVLHHGKRADWIVKGMLQHSRTGPTQKEPTDINALADEYFRLSYHGLRAKDNSFAAQMQTHFDKTIGLVKIMPQEIGRVLLNLFTNAFYSVTEKKKILMTPGAGNENFQKYEPTVSVSTRAIKRPSGHPAISISVKDNGMGISQKVLDKIYQPFFTTKPTGRGTGLGLSLSYDIIKAHGGEIHVESKEGEFAEFIITLPL